MADSWEEQAEEQIVYQPEKPKLNPNAGTFNFSAGAASFNPGASFTPRQLPPPLRSPWSPRSPLPSQSRRRKPLPRRRSLPSPTPWRSQPLLLLLLLKVRM